MIIKERSLYRKFIDWWDSWAPIGFWDSSKSKVSPGMFIIICLVVFLARYFDDVWIPFVHYYFPDSIPLLDYEPYSP